MSEAAPVPDETALPGELPARTLALLRRGGVEALRAFVVALAWTFVIAVGFAFAIALATNALRAPESVAAVFTTFAVGLVFAVGFAFAHLMPLEAFAASLGPNMPGRERRPTLLLPGFTIFVGGSVLSLGLVAALVLLRERFELVVVFVPIAISAIAAWIYGRGLVSAARAFVAPAAPTRTWRAWLVEPFVGSLTPCAFAAIAMPSLLSPINPAVGPLEVTWHGALMGVIVLPASLLASCAAAVALASRPAKEAA